MTGRPWTVDGLGDHSEIYCTKLKSWVKASSWILRPTGKVVAVGKTEAGERVTLEMKPGEVWTVR